MVIDLNPIYGMLGAEWFKPISSQCAIYTETFPLICNANQLTDICMS